MRASISTSICCWYKSYTITIKDGSIKIKNVASLQEAAEYTKQLCDDSVWLTIRWLKKRKGKRFKNHRYAVLFLLCKTVRDRSIRGISINCVPHSGLKSTNQFFGCDSKIVWFVTANIVCLYTQCTIISHESYGWAYNGKETGEKKWKEM